jgi:hypothetical protein
MSDEELKALEAYVYSHKIIHTELFQYLIISCYLLYLLCSLALPQDAASIRAKTKTIHKYEWFYDYIQHRLFFYLKKWKQFISKRR